MEVLVRVPGTCGELIQGSIGGCTFHVSCPIDLYAELSVRIGSPGMGILAPSGYTKAVRAFQATLSFLGESNIGGEIIIHQALPAGKGLASSTADIAGICVAVATALGYELSAHEVARIALSIEPTDGLMLPGINLFDHRQGQVQEWIGESLPVGILMLDLGGRVDTISFNQQPDLLEANQAKEKQLKLALALVRSAFAKGDLALLGQAATLSAQANQLMLPKAMLPRLIEISEQLGCLGVNIAHSGTVVGLLYDLRTVSGVELRRQVLSLLPQEYPHWLVRMVNGGVQIVAEGESKLCRTSRISRTSMEEISDPPKQSLA